MPTAVPLKGNILSHSLHAFLNNIVVIMRKLVLSFAGAISFSSHCASLLDFLVQTLQASDPSWSLESEKWLLDGSPRATTRVSSDIFVFISNLCVCDFGWWLCRILVCWYALHVTTKIPLTFRNHFYGIFSRVRDSSLEMDRLQICVHWLRTLRVEHWSKLNRACFLSSIECRCTRPNAGEVSHCNLLFRCVLLWFVSLFMFWCKLWHHIDRRMCWDWRKVCFKMKGMCFSRNECIVRSEVNILKTYISAWQNIFSHFA